MSEEPEGGESEWGCIVPFLDRDNKYAYGVEFGILYEQLKHSDSISELFCLANQDQILLLLSRLGWRVIKMEALDEFWFSLTAER